MSLKDCPAADVTAEVLKNLVNNGYDIKSLNCLHPHCPCKVYSVGRYNPSGLIVNRDIPPNGQCRFEKLQEIVAQGGASEGDIRELRFIRRLVPFPGGIGRKK